MTKTNLFVQSDCRQLTSIKGGSTFEIFGYNTFFLTSCVSIDQEDGNYSVSCLFPYKSIVNFDLRRDAVRYLNISAMVYYEHLDTFSEVLGSQTIGAELTPSN